MRWVLLALLAVVVLLQVRLWTGDGGLREGAALREEIAATRLELERSRARNRALEAEVTDLRAGLDALEERARSELGMIKRGEVFLQIIGEPASEPEP